MVLSFIFSKTGKNYRIFFIILLYFLGLFVLVFGQQILASSTSDFKLFVSNESDPSMDQSTIFNFAEPFIEYSTDKKLKIIPEAETEATGNPIDLQFGGEIMASLHLRNYTDSGLGDLANFDDTASYNLSNLLIGGSPKPDLSYWGMTGATYLEHLGNLSSRNAILLDFQTPVSGFGGFFGDLRTRTDGKGVPALIKAFDSENQQIYSSEIKNSNSNNKLCGDFDVDSTSLCGKNSTKFVGLVSKISNISRVLIVIGEDKASESGYGPHFSTLGLVTVMPQISLDYQVFYDKDSDGSKDRLEPEIDLVDYQVTRLDSGLESSNNDLRPGEYNLELSISPEDIAKYQIQDLSALSQDIVLEYGENNLAPIALNSLEPSLANEQPLSKFNSVNNALIEQSENINTNKTTNTTTKSLPKTGINNRATLWLAILYSCIFGLIYHKKIIPVSSDN